MRDFLRPAAALALLTAAYAAHAFEPFTVKDIRIEGLQRVAVGTVFSYLPVRVNERFDRQLASETIRALYETGFFQDVTLSRDGDELVLQLLERPSIARVDISGNEELSTEDLKKSLKEIGLSEGQILNRALLDGIEQELERQYLARSLYDTDITTTISPLPRNRVGVRIDITEGEAAKIAQINIVGNEVFSESKLLKQFELGPSPWWALLSSSDQYARDRLAADLDKLTAYYQNRGYLNFAVTSTQVTVTEDRGRIYITVNVSEGEQYRFGEIDLSGEFIVEKSELRALLELETGDVFSRSQVTDATSRIRDRLSTLGYAFANVNPVPQVDEASKSVDFTFIVDPGRRVFVRQINILGNLNTDDAVIRRELRQMEGAPLDNGKIKRSKQRLDRLGFFENVSVDTQQVPGTTDQVDVTVDVNERLSGSFQAGLGYSDQQGVLLSLGLQQDNLLGTGNRLKFSVDTSKANRQVSTTFTERFYTLSGISRSFIFSYQDQDADELSLASFSLRENRAGVNYLFPLSETDSFSSGLFVEAPSVELGSEPAQRIVDFVDEQGEDFVNYALHLGWSQDTLNRAIFPDEGYKIRFNGEYTVPGSDLTFYKLFGSYQQYFGLTDSLTLSIESSVAYGAGYGDTEKLPFFENYYAGGISSVRGFTSGSLSLRDDDVDRPIGGNFRVLGSIGVSMPVPGLDFDSMRMVTFIDTGYAYDLEEEDFDLDKLRVSGGVGVTWLSPLGALSFSLAQPISAEDDDDTEVFQFSLGQPF